MRKFDLEAAKRGEPIVTRNGQEAHFLAHTDKLSKPFEVVAAIDGGPSVHTKDGHFYSKDVAHASDLFMKPKKRTVWVNLYKQPLLGQDAEWFDSQEGADGMACATRIGGRAWPVEIEELD